jgi:TRAP-type C4-dicarboxylate transport system permease small subunit
MKESSALKIIFSRITGFLILIIFLALANIFVHFIPNELAQEMVNFLNSSLLILVILALIGIINELFWNFKFPINLIAPIISAIFSFFILKFLFSLWEIISEHQSYTFTLPQNLLYATIPILVLAIGYLIILIDFIKLFSSDRQNEKESEDEDEEDEQEIEGKKKIIIFSL